jgi:precorrin-6B C5,15-methyltransferase / cobalt-precorrin-6B C5,C15-methyltransferase
VHEGGYYACFIPAHKNMMPDDPISGQAAPHTGGTTLQPRHDSASPIVDAYAAPWLTVVGIGENGFGGLDKYARRALRAAAIIFGSPRQLDLLATCIRAQRHTWPSPFDVTTLLKYRGSPVCVLASGDPMFFGVGATLARQIPIAEMQVLPAPSSCSLAAAQLGWPLQDCTVLSLVGRPLAALHAQLFEGARLLVLSADGSSPAAVAQLLANSGFGPSRLAVFEHIGGPRERRIDGEAQHWSAAECAALNIVAVECIAGAATQGLPRTAGLPDTAYRHDGQLTKRDVRAIALARLAPRPFELLWDVGAGCGSIGIEWLRADPRCRAIAIEADAARQQLIEHNRDALGVPQLQLIKGSAPLALAGLDRPDAIFIGGGVTRDNVLETCWRALPSGGRLVANAVTLESEMRLQQWRAQYGGELTRIDIAQAQPLGGFETWRAALPVVLLHCVK